MIHQVGFRTLREKQNAIFVSWEYEMLLPFCEPYRCPSHTQSRILPISRMVCIGVRVIQDGTISQHVRLRPARTAR